MLFQYVLRPLPVADGITIDAAVRAAVIAADIAGFRAQAAGPVAFLPGLDRLTRDIRQSG